MTFLVFFAGALTGAVVTAFICAGNSGDRFLDAFGAAASAVLRPSLPFWLWARATRDRQGRLGMTDMNGVSVRCVTDGNEWVGVMPKDGKFTFSPLFLLPAGLVRALVRLTGREVKLVTGDEDGNRTGFILRGLQVAPGLTLARRSNEDLRYLAEHHRFPTVPLT